MNETTKMCTCATEQNQDADCAIHGEWYRQRDAHNTAIAATPLPAVDPTTLRDALVALYRAAHISSRPSACYDLKPLLGLEHEATEFEVADAVLSRALAPHGEAVAWMTRNGEHVVTASERDRWLNQYAKDEMPIPLYTHPAPAARVTSEMVERGCAALATEDGNNWPILDEEVKKHYRATIGNVLTAALSAGGK